MSLTVIFFLIAPLPPTVESRQNSNESSSSQPSRSSNFKLHMPHASSKSKKSSSPSSNPKKSSNASYNSGAVSRSKSAYAATTRSGASVQPPSKPYNQPTSHNSSSQDWSAELIATTIYPFQGEKPCDLSFNVGERITIITRTATQEDWWEGKLNGKVGIFPANYVKVN